MKFSYQTGASGSRLRYELGYSSVATTRYWAVAIVVCCLLVLPAAVSFHNVMPKRETVSALPPTPQLVSAQPASTVQTETDFVGAGTVFSAELEAWLKKRPGQYGVFVGGTDGNIIISLV